MSKILVVDDEEYMGWIIQKAFTKLDFEVNVALRGKEGLKIIENDSVDLVLLDLRMPDIDGMEVLKQIKILQPDLPVIIITAHGTIDTAIQSMKEGAFDYITKPFDIDELILLVQKAAEMGRLKNEVVYLRNQVNLKNNTIQYESQNSKMQQVISICNQVAESNATVLITGESGTGKEVMARFIHERSLRNNKSFIPINCAALPENLLESELFGYEKGAFTGAVSRRIGRFELAQGGTIFLDEIGEMSLNMQVKLLRVLQEREVQRVGGNSSIKVDVRIIAATNKNLVQAIEKGVFREDLYYRLNVVPVELPPLRFRKEDISGLINIFIKKYDVQGRIKGITEEAMELIEGYKWPGNIRELENVIERLVILSRESYIEPGQLPAEILNNEKNEEDNIIYFPKQGIDLEKVEKDLIIKSLKMSDGNQTKAAELLSITRSALIYRMQKYDIKIEAKMEV